MKYAKLTVLVIVSVLVVVSCGFGPDPSLDTPHIQVVFATTNATRSTASRGDIRNGTAFLNDYYTAFGNQRAAVTPTKILMQNSLSLENQTSTISFGDGESMIDLISGSLVPVEGEIFPGTYTHLIFSPGWRDTGQTAEPPRVHLPLTEYDSTSMPDFDGAEWVDASTYAIEPLLLLPEFFLEDTSETPPANYWIHFEYIIFDSTVTEPLVFTPDLNDYFSSYTIGDLTGISRLNSSSTNQCAIIVPMEPIVIEEEKNYEITISWNIENIVAVFDGSTPGLLLDDTLRFENGFWENIFIQATEIQSTIE